MLNNKVIGAVKDEKRIICVFFLLLSIAILCINKVCSDIAALLKEIEDKYFLHEKG